MRSAEQIAPSRAGTARHGGIWRSALDRACLAQELQKFPEALAIKPPCLADVEKLSVSLSRTAPKYPTLCRVG